MPLGAVRLETRPTENLAASSRTPQPYRPSILLGPVAHTTHSSGLSGPAYLLAFGEQINGSGSTFSANKSMRCFRRAPMHAHQLALSLLLPTTGKGRGSPEAPPRLEAMVVNCLKKKNLIT